jgi:aspartokinase
MTSRISSLNPTPDNSTNIRDNAVKKVEERRSVDNDISMSKPDKQQTTQGMTSASVNISYHKSLAILRNTSTDELKKLANKPKALSLEEQNKLLLESLQDSVFELQDQSVAILEEIKKVSYIINGLTKKIKILHTIVENINNNQNQNQNQNRRY